MNDSLETSILNASVSDSRSRLFVEGNQSIETASLSNEIVCLIEPPLAPKTNSQNPANQKNLENLENLENPHKKCPPPDKDRDSQFLKILSLLLAGGGIAGTGAGLFSLALKLRDLIGDPKLDLQKYLQSPDYWGNSR